MVDREVQVARSCYLAQKELRCIWSDRLLNKEKLAVDHALPFALWRNNDLWNLLPSHHSVNSDKSDKVPTPAFLERRKEAIIHCWTQIHLQEPKLFEYEVTRLLGSALRNDWENHLFGYFKRNAEYGIFLRGAKPWEGAKVSRIPTNLKDE